MSPKASLGLLTVACIALGVARSDHSPAVSAKAKIQINFWNGWTGPDGRVALQMIRDFNEKNPDIQVTMQRMPWDTYYNKLMVAAMDNRGPEVFVIHASTLPRMERAGFLARVDDLFAGNPTGYAPQQPIDPADFETQVLDAVRFDDHFVALPLDIHPQGLYVNRKMLASVGYDHPPVNKAEFLDLARKLKRDTDHDGVPDQWGFALTLGRNNFMNLIPQFGGRYLDEKGNADLDNPANVQAMDFFAQLEKEKLVPPPENGLGWVGYRQGKVAMVWDGVYMVGDLKRLDTLSYEGAPIPVIGNHGGTLADSHCLCIRKDLPADQRAAAERFIRYFSDHSLEWADAGQVPARKSIRSSPAFRQMQVQYAFSRQIPQMMYPPRTIALFEITLEIDLAVEKVTRGRATAAEALKVANAHAQQVIDRERAEGSKSP